jgi:methyl-accepting chemotaxis protein
MLAAGVTQRCERNTARLLPNKPILQLQLFTNIRLTPRMNLKKQHPNQKNMKNWTIGKRITAGFASVIIIALTLGGFAYTRLVAIKGHSDQIARKSLPTFELIAKGQRNVRQYETILYKHIGSVDKEDKTRLEGNLQAITVDSTKIFTELDEFITDEKGKALVQKTKSTRAEFGQIRDKVIEASRQATNEASAYDLARNQLDPACDRYVAAMDALAEAIQTDADNTSKSIQSAVQSSQMGILLGLILASVVGIGLAIVIIRGTANILSQVSVSLEDGSNQLAGTAAQITASSQSLAEGASEQAASLEETSSSLEEMSSMTKRNAENAHKANDLAKQARQAADKGAGDMHRQDY